MTSCSEGSVEERKGTDEVETPFCPRTARACSQLAHVTVILFLDTILRPCSDVVFPHTFPKGT